MAQVRRELGEDAVILSSRRVADGFEIVAAAPQVMDRLVERVSTRTAPTVNPVPAKPVPARIPARRSDASVAQIRPDESFQEFVRRQTQSPGQGSTRHSVARPTATPVPEARVSSGRHVAQGVSNRYQEVARAPEPTEASEEDLWKPTTFLLPTQDASVSAPVAPAPRQAPPRPETAAVPVQSGQTLSASLSRANGSDMGASNRLPTRWLSSESSVPEVPAPAVFHRRTEPRIEPQVTQSTPAPVAQQPAIKEQTPSTPVAVASPIVPPVAPQPTVGIQPVVQPPVVNPQPTAVVQPTVATAPASMVSEPAEQKLLQELVAMRAHLQRQIERLSTTVSADRQQLQSQLTNSLMQLQAAAQRNTQSLPARVMTRLLTSGYSPEVARKVALHVPQTLALPEAETWLQDVLALNLKVIDAARSMTEAGGVYALVGPTGVGKTTTVAKLAARFAVKYGSGALGLITLDAYRLGAHEQLRSFGRILGAPVHLVQDSGTLRELLVSMQTKRLVLIDTCGVSQRDSRLNELLSMITTASQSVPEAMRVQRVLLTNAASHAETLDETARAWRASECVGCVLTKLDEAVRIGGALDAALRHKMRLLGVTNGQRVPEDWHAANARVLAHLSLKPGADAFALSENEALGLTSGGHTAGFEPMVQSF